MQLGAKPFDAAKIQVAAFIFKDIFWVL